MNDPSRVRVTGPLAEYAAGFRDELAARGYAPGSAALQLQLVAQLSRWLEGQALDVSALTAERVELFFELRRKRVRELQVSAKALHVFLDHLSVVGALPAPERVELSPTEKLVERYGRYLLQERGLGLGTVRRYQHVARRFLSTCLRADDLDVESVSAAAATEFLLAECRTRTIGWAKGVASVLRSLLRFFYVEALISAPLAHAVPTPAGWSGSSLPKALKGEELAALLAGCDRRSDTGRRDYAVILLAARLGLRAAEIASLELGDVDWREGKLRVRGKGHRVDLLPLPVDVGRALAAYVREGRPQVGGVLFRRVGAPHGGVMPTTVTGIVYRACDRAGIPRVGAHRPRHTAATQMLWAGSSLPEIAQVLRHRSPTTTAIYAKVDRDSLRTLAQPWPGDDA